MLVGLRLQNIALIDTLDLPFHEGFSVFTGETGAGKSIFLEALDVLLAGGDSSSALRLLRKGSNKSSIEASFSLTAQIHSWLLKSGFENERTTFCL